MSAAHALALAGSLFSIAGSFVLIIDAIEGPVRWFDRVYFPEGARKTAAFVRDRVVEMTQALPPVYSPEDKRELIEKAEKDYETRMSEIKADVDSKELADKFRSRNRAVVGFSLLGIGVVLLGIGALVS